MTLKYIREASDLHLDFDATAWLELPKYDPRKLSRMPEIDFIWSPPPLPTDHETALLLPGDLWVGHRALERRFAGPESWVERVAKRFHSVILLPGNHDYWDAELDGWVLKARRLLESQGVTNVHVLENNAVVIDNVKFLGGTLWTDMKKHDPMIVMNAPKTMNDYEYIRRKVGMVYRKLWSQDILDAHKKTREFILSAARRDNPEQHVVVLSHHAPSFQSIHERFRTTHSWNDNFYYFSDIDWYLCDDEVEVDLWVHGHVHNFVDYLIDRTRVLCNPRGYSSHETYAQTGFKENLLIEVAHLRNPRAPDERLAEVPTIEELHDE